LTSLKRLNELSMLTKRQSMLMKRLTHAKKSAGKEVEQLRKELLEAVDNGAGIEHGGRIVRRNEKEETAS
jgi:hypothetical protein